MCVERVYALFFLKLERFLFVFVGNCFPVKIVRIRIVDRLFYLFIY